MSVQIIRGNALALPLADDTVDLVVTSPPYFGLRSYQDGGEHYDGQIGDEATPAEFVDALIAATAEMVRVVKPSGSIWVNLGDKYANKASGTVTTGLANGERSSGVAPDLRRTFREKSLLGIPWRYALRCIDDLGLILRAEVIWSKPNGLPESVTDRVRRSHEQWFWFEQSGGVEAATQRFPFCPLCGRPVDARSTLIARLKEADRGVESLDLAHEVRSEDRVDGEHAGRGDHDVAVVPGVPAVPMLEALDTEACVGGSHLLEDGGVAVVDADSQERPTLPLHQRDGALSVDDASEPSDVCQCVGHPLIIDDEPWIPQSLAADIMQRVAEGEVDPQQAADFLSGDYVRNHSVWFHFTLSPRYYSAVDEIREAHVNPARSAPSWADRKSAGEPVRQGEQRATASGGVYAESPLGKLPGSVWTIPTEPLHVPESLGIDHFAAYPTEWPRRIIQGWSPRGICVECGEGRRPVADVERTAWAGDPMAMRAMTAGAVDGGPRKWKDASRTITGEACACPEPTAPTRPGVVLDPFGGTGTTAIVAQALGRDAVHVDMSADYCRLATWRTNDPKQQAKAARREFKPSAEKIDGQLDLLEGLGA